MRLFLNMLVWVLAGAATVLAFAITVAGR